MIPWSKNIRDSALSREQRVEAHILLARANRALEAGEPSRSASLVEQAHRIGQNDIRLHTLAHLRWLQTEIAQRRPIASLVQFRLLTGAPMGTVARRIRGLGVGEPGGRGVLGTLFLRPRKDL